MSLEVIKRSRIKIQDKGNNLYLVQVDLTNREKYANLYYIKDDEINGENAYSIIVRFLRSSYILLNIMLELC